MNDKDLARLRLSLRQEKLFPGRRFPTQPTAAEKQDAAAEKRDAAADKKPTAAQKRAALEAERRAAVAEKNEIMRKRGEKHMLTEEQKKHFLDLERIEIFFKYKGTGDWCSSKVYVSAVKEKAVPRFRSSLLLSGYLSEKMGLKVGSIFVLERFRRTTTKVYALTIVGTADITSRRQKRSTCLLSVWCFVSPVFLFSLLLFL
jgi:hypothetical protein